MDECLLFFWGGSSFPKVRILKLTIRVRRNVSITSDPNVRCTMNCWQANGIKKERASFHGEEQSVDQMGIKLNQQIGRYIRRLRDENGLQLLGSWSKEAISLSTTTVPFQQPFPLKAVQGSSKILVHLFHFVFSQCDDTKYIAAVFEGRYNVGFRECKFCDCQDYFLWDILLAIWWLLPLFYCSLPRKLSPIDWFIFHPWRPHLFGCMQHSHWW